MELVLQALGNHKASEDELEQIKALIASIEEEQSKYEGHTQYFVIYV
jgi:hypothetical protein